MSVIDISTLPRIKDQEEANVLMWFENEEGTHTVSVVKATLGVYEIRISTPIVKVTILTDKHQITEKDVRRSLRNWIAGHNSLRYKGEKL